VAGAGQVIRPCIIRGHIALKHDSLHYEYEDKNQKAKTVSMKKGRKRGEGVWLGTVSGLGTPDRDL
jgi:hypothetical protein